MLDKGPGREEKRKDCSLRYQRQNICGYALWDIFFHLTYHLLWYLAVIHISRSVRLLSACKLTAHALILILFWEPWGEICTISSQNVNPKNIFLWSLKIFIQSFLIQSFLPGVRMQIRVAGQEVENLCQSCTRICIVCVKVQSGWKAVCALSAACTSENRRYKPYASSLQDVQPSHQPPKHLVQMVIHTAMKCFQSVLGNSVVLAVPGWLKIVPSS